MRLSENEVQCIKAVVARLAGPAARLSLFGSRTRDGLRGGDIDLLIEFEHPVAEPAWLAASVEAAIVMGLGDRKVDVLVSAPNLVNGPVHRAARASGVAL